MKRLRGEKQLDLFIIGFFFMCLFVQTASGQSLLPIGYEEFKVATLRSAELEIDIVENSEYNSDHRAGYNGIARMQHIAQDSNIFVARYAGFNHEHIFDGDSLVNFFEPRKEPMRLFKKNADEVLLYQAPTALSKTESLTSFKIVDPYFVDVEFTCVFHDIAFFDHDYAGLFWASYINQPPNMHIYFPDSSSTLEEASWVDAFSPVHGKVSTHISKDESDEFYFAENFNATLANNLSGEVFGLPFFYGRYHNMVLGYLFSTDQVIRFTQSPSGGGEGNPAWDFQFLIPDPKVGQAYKFRCRLVYKEFVDQKEMLKLFRNWVSQKK